MRRKRSYRIKPSQKEDTLNKILHFDELNGRRGEYSGGSHERSDVKATNSSCPLYGKLPLLSGTVNSLNVRTLDGKFDSVNRDAEEVDTEATAQHSNVLTTRSSESPTVDGGLWLSKPEKLESEASLGRCESLRKSFDQINKSGAEGSILIDERPHSSAANPGVSAGDSQIERGIDALSRAKGVCKIPIGITVLNNESCGSQNLVRESNSSARNLSPMVIHSDVEDLFCIL